eukprot:m.133750 g.133750  ORF g.133750 m.133750 type:complete len:345 (-) comp14835_c0_seq1:196-1230(-)
MASDTQWELSPYELEREPHPVRDGHVVLPRAALNSFLKCPVCLSVLADSMTVMECLHHFCGDCISKSLRWGKKECPTCRTGVPSRRSLRPNAAIDGLVSVVCPDRTNFEQQQEDMLSKIRSHHNQKALSESIVSGMKDQALLRASRARMDQSLLRGARGRFVSADPRAASRAKRARGSNPIDNGAPDLEGPQTFTEAAPSQSPLPTHPPTAAPAAASGSSHSHSHAPHAHAQNTTQSARGTLPDPQAMLVLLPCPYPEDQQQPPLPMPYLTTSMDCTIAHLLAYVDRYANPTDVVSIFAEDEDGHLQPQAPTQTLRALINALSPEQREHPFTLYYGLTEEMEDA